MTIWSIKEMKKSFLSFTERKEIRIVLRFFDFIPYKYKEHEGANLMINFNKEKKNETNKVEMNDILEDTFLIKVRVEFFK